MKFEVITDFEDALDFLSDDSWALRLFKTWIPREKFIELLYSESGFSIYRSDSTPIAFSLGIEPPIRSSWMRLNIQRGVKAIEKINSKERSDWETYFIDIPTEGLVGPEARSRSDAEIDSFLKLHAPKSSVFPGNKEIVKWACVDVEDELAGVAAICRWESGEHVVVSVATHAQMRGNGVGLKVMEQTLKVAQQELISSLCLGVVSDNSPAIKLYEKVGWKPLFKFTYLERE
ncbi:MAG: GNAT family N-acetyltransferase [Actinomycetota bacterium]